MSSEPIRSGEKILNVSHAHRCIFIHIPKAAGTSIKKVFGMDDSGGHPGWHWYAEKYPDVWNSYTSFAVVRNPWDRFVSSYRHAQMKNSYWHDEEQGLHSDYDVLANKTLDDCLHMLCNERERLRHPAWRAQTTWLVDLQGPERKIMVDHILRYEQLDADFARLCEIAGHAAANAAHDQPLQALARLSAIFQRPDPAARRAGLRRRRGDLRLQLLVPARPARSIGPSSGLLAAAVS